MANQGESDAYTGVRVTVNVEPDAAAMYRSNSLPRTSSGRLEDHRDISGLGDQAAVFFRLYTQPSAEGSSSVFVLLGNAFITVGFTGTSRAADGTSIPISQQYAETAALAIARDIVSHLG